MLTPRFFFENDFRQFHDYFLSQPHKEKSFHKGEYLWKLGQPYKEIHYIISGTAMNYAIHKNGNRKIITFHGPGTVFPGYRQHDYKIELSLTTVALSDMEVLAFTKVEFQAMFEANTNLSEAIVDWYSKYVNRLLYEIAHQEYNTSLTKLCNLLYLLAQSCSTCVDMTQDEIADMLGLSRVHVTRGLAELRHNNVISTQRGVIKVIDLPVLAEYCSSETVE